MRSSVPKPISTKSGAWFCPRDHCVCKASARAKMMPAPERMTVRLFSL
jgi:hypothetical protein